VIGLHICTYDTRIVLRWVVWIHTISMLSLGINTRRNWNRPWIQFHLWNSGAIDNCTWSCRDFRTPMYSGSRWDDWSCWDIWRWRDQLILRCKTYNGMTRSIFPIIRIIQVLAFTIFCKWGQRKTLNGLANSLYIMFPWNLLRCNLFNHLGGLIFNCMMNCRRRRCGQLSIGGNCVDKASNVLLLRSWSYIVFI
jgi:hypothetical protein